MASAADCPLFNQHCSAGVGTQLSTILTSGAAASLSMRHQVLHLQPSRPPPRSLHCSPRAQSCHGRRGRWLPTRSLAGGGEAHASADYRWRSPADASSPDKCCGPLAAGCAGHRL